MNDGSEGRSAEFSAFSDRYLKQFAAAILELDRSALAQMLSVLERARAGGHTVFIAGNGGSAAVANHFECDASKGTFVDGASPLRSRSLVANTSVLTALANDLGYEHVFSKQLDYYARPGDVLILVSSSGSSPNVVEACHAAKAKGLTTMALVGFRGGALKTLADVVLHVPIENYGIVEDAHQAVVHLLTQFMKQRDSGS